jgi:hypothetical protein
MSLLGFAEQCLARLTGSRISRRSVAPAARFAWAKLVHWKTLQFFCVEGARMGRQFVTRDQAGSQNIFLWFVAPYEADGEWFSDAGQQSPLGRDPRVKLDEWQCQQHIGRVLRPGEKVELRNSVVIAKRAKGAA